MFKIEKGIPMPVSVSKSEIFPFEQMEVDDSFYVPFGETDPAIVKRHVANAISNVNFRNSKPATSGEMKLNNKGNHVPVMIPIKKFSSKSDVDGVRVWRIL